MPRITLAALAAALLLTACDTAETGNSTKPGRALLPEDSVQRLATDGEAEFRRVMEAYPEAMALALLDRSGKGLVIYRNGVVVHYPFASNINSELQIRSEVSRSEDNTLCMAPKDSWTGACFSVTPAPEAKLSMEAKFGNGATRTETVTPYVLLSKDET